MISAPQAAFQLLHLLLQELSYWAEGSPENQLRRNTLDAIPTLYEDAFDPGDAWEGSGALGHAAASPSTSPGPSPVTPAGQAPLNPGDPAHIMHGASPSHSQKDSAKASEEGDSIFSVKGISSKLPCPSCFSSKAFQVLAHQVLSVKAMAIQSCRRLKCPSNALPLYTLNLWNKRREWMKPHLRLAQCCVDLLEGLR